MKRVILFAEGPRPGLFDPLDQIRPAYLLRNGAWSFSERWIQLLEPATVHAAVRPWLRDLVAEQTGWVVNDAIGDVPDDFWLIIGAVSPKNAKRWTNIDCPASFTWKSGDNVVIRLTGGELEHYRSRLEPWIQSGGVGPCPCDLHKQEDDLPFQAASAPWDIIEQLPEQLLFDSWLWPLRNSTNSSREGCHASAVLDDKEHEILLGEGVKIGPHTVIRADDGPVIIDREAVIEPFTRLDGPAYVGPYTHLVGGKITGGCAFGPGCKIGGEVEASVVHGFSNKVHDGFFGHGYLGEWVNIGAATTNSDLKNTFGKVSVSRAGEMVDTQLLKVGSYLSDHTKTGIGTLLPTGAAFGVGVNIIKGGLTEKTIPSFMWGGAGHYVVHGLERMLRTAAMTVHRRRKIRKKIGLPEEMTDAEKVVLREHFGRSDADRQAFLDRQASRPRR